MSTAVLEIEVDADLKERAEVVFEELGTSTSRIVNLLLNHVAVLKKIPENLGVPPVPCIDDMTEEELDEIFLDGIREIEGEQGIPSEIVEEELRDRYGIEL
ncbi:MAG: type II toxin-antitoxin system RelB/DinJ family antitoxin [Synergistaceae bacterium]|nr:type II toxin-antitoxin system RelB/DinJ family antitoxin [Synergistaceae bacterium]